jgi:hypothetical protein
VVGVLYSTTPGSKLFGVYPLVSQGRNKNPEVESKKNPWGKKCCVLDGMIMTRQCTPGGERSVIQEARQGGTRQ